MVWTFFSSLPHLFKDLKLQYDVLMPPSLRIRFRKASRYFSRRQNLLVAASLVYLCGLLVFSLKGERGLLKSYRLWRESQHLSAQIDRLERETRELKSQVHLFRTDLRTVERYARDHLRLVGENEVHYIFR
jgi:cell division protein FtsB